MLYLSLDNAKVKLPSTSINLFNNIGLEKEIYNLKQPLL